MEKPTIIVIDDEEDWLAIISAKLDRIGKDYAIMVETFSSFDDAGKRLEKHPIDFDLLITDIFPFGSDETIGLDFAEFADNRKIPVIIVTGRDRGYVERILKGHKFKNVFDKGTFNKFKFYNLIEKIIKRKVNSKEVSALNDNKKDHRKDLDTPPPFL